MSENSTEGLSRTLRWLCWIPLASLLGIELYIRNFDGWGAWASAPLLLVPAMLSLPVVILALSACVSTLRTRGQLSVAVLVTLVSAVPIIWLGVRRFIM